MGDGRCPTFCSGRRARPGLILGRPRAYNLKRRIQCAMTLENNRADRRAMLKTTRPPLILSKRPARGGAIVGIFHDEEAREAVADRLFKIGNQSTAMAAPAVAVAEACA